MTQTSFGMGTRTTAKPLAAAEFEMVVDNFAGAGGASMGIEAALGRAVDVAINHNPEAIEIHQVNHPNTVHYTENIWKVDPVEACGGRPVGLAWFSPDCTHFSKAKGGQPVKKHIRGLAWVVIKWAKLVKPRVIILENVEEFKDWGPVGSDFKPIVSRKREYFNGWKATLKRQGYVVDHRELIAADYGAPTIRKRFFLIARCDGQPIVWPSQSHWKRNVAGPGQPTWRAAAECIDWNLPCPSIFTRNRPLAENTMRRIAMGMKKFVFDSKEPFIVTCNHAGGDRGQSTQDPMMTLTAARDAHGVVVPHVTKFRNGSIGQDVRDPLSTITAGGKSKRPAGSPHALGLIAPHLVGIDNKGKDGKNPGSWDPKEPTRTITSENRHALVSAFLNKHYTGVVGSELDGPLGTVTSIDHHSLTEAFLTKYNKSSIGSNPKEPLPTATSMNKDALVAPFLSKFRGSCRHGQDIQEPMATLTGGGYHIAQVQAFLIKYFGTAIGQDLFGPIHTLTGKHRFGLIEVQGVDYHIADIGLRMLTPLELLRAQFGKYAANYVLLGTNSRKVAAIGNSVCPEMAEALVKANVMIRKIA